MPNEQNLIPMDQRSQSEARKLGREGGRASGESRRRKKSLREAAELYLSLPVSDKRAWNKLAHDGVDPEDVDNQMAIIAGLTMRAIKGDSKAAKVIFELIGPAESALEPTGVESMTLAEKMAAIRERDEARIVEREIREDGETGFRSAYIRWVMPLVERPQKRRRRHEE